MIQIALSKEEFLNETHDLVKAFYPEEQIKVVIESLKVNLSDNENNSTPTTCKEIISSDKQFTIFIQMDDSIRITVQQGSLILYSDYGHQLLKDKKQYRNYLKRLLYRCLSSLTKKELPWGTLTGVRPTKITYELLEQHVSNDDIISYMKEQYYCSDEKIETSLKVAKRELTLLNEMDYKNGYSIYIGIPFCPSTCLYCSFTSYSIEKYHDMVEQYLQALFREIAYAGTCLKDRKLTTVYLGGGTPTTLSAEQLNNLLNYIRNHFDFTFVSEFTVEAGRPDSITEEKLRVLKTYGVNRISINPQTMNQRTLDLIGRKHTVRQIAETFQLARKTGHDNINMDIIIGLPGENKEDVAYTLNEIGKLDPDSLTVHTLALKRAARLNLMKDDYRDLTPSDTIEMLRLSSEFASMKGYLPYYLYRQKNMAGNLENIGYAKFGKEGLYNILIMEEKQTILALGAGALSKFIFYEDNRIERVENVKSLLDYINRVDEMIERKQEFLIRNYYK